MKPRRGVSEIIASMVVLMVVSVLGVMLYNISLEGLNGQQNNLLSDVGRSEQISQERCEIVAVTGLAATESNPQRANITFYNYGPVDIKITDIYLKSGATVIQHILLASDDNELSPYLLEPTHKGILLTSDLTWIAIRWYPNITSYTLTSQEGVSFEFTLSQPIQ